MKKILIILSVMFISGVCLAADQVITITIPDAKVAIALTGFLKVYPNREKNENGSPRYTDGEWVREKVRRNFVKDATKGLRRIKDETDRIEEDNTIAQ